MDTLFYPQSIAVIGVSEADDNLARNIARNLEAFRYPGQVFLVGRRSGRIPQGPIHPDLASLPATPELAVLLVPAQQVPAVLEVCGHKGIRWAVIETGGFGEYSEEGSSLEAEVLATARRHGIRCVGPNCISIANIDNGMVLPFVKLDPSTIRRGPVSLLSQSGGVIFGGVKLFSCENIGCNKLVSIGNKLDLTENDYLEYLIRDDGTQVIGLHLESIADGRGLMRLALSTAKPIVALKANTAEASREIARFHTAALAGDDAVCDAAFAQAGIHRVATFAEMMDHLKIFELPPLRGPRLAVIGRSGGQTVMAADAAAQYGFELPPFPTALMDLIRQRVRAGVIRLTNPLDLGDVFDLGFYTEVVEAALAEPDIDGVLLQHLHDRLSETAVTVDLFRAVNTLSHRHGKPVAICFMSERDEYFPVKTTTDFPVFLEPHGAIQALAASLRHHRRGQRQPSAPAVQPAPEPPAAEPRLAAPAEVFRCLHDAGIRAPAFEIAHDVPAALAAAERIGYPVAVKIALPAVLHKTDLGGVALGVGDRRALAEAAEKVARTVPEAGGRVPLLVQQMAPAGAEVILGAKRDPEFGPIVLFGLGGILAEVFQDVAIRVAPVAERIAEEMIRQLRGFLLLAGYRDRPPCDLPALVETIARFSAILLRDSAVEELEINPLIVLEEGRGCVAVDGRMRTRDRREGG